MNNAVSKLKEYMQKFRQYETIENLLYWDLSTMTPEKGVESKADAIGYFSTEAFRLSTSDEYGALLKELSTPEQFKQLDDALKVTVQRELRNYERFVRVPEDFYTEYVTCKARSQKAWEAAKKADDYSLYAPHLDKIISMTKQYVHYMEPEQPPYEVLVDMFEEGMDTCTIDRIFDELKEGLRPLLAKIKESKQPDLSALKGTYDIPAQKELQELLLSYIGFDFSMGAVAESEHPFTTGIGSGDVRVTNHFREDDPIAAIFSAIHEGGHAIFDQNISPVYENTVVRQVNLMGLHESQSRFYENILGRNRNFWTPLYEKMGELLPRFRNIPFETFYRAINEVKPSLIRIDADEVTYCLHIILRYEIERAIFNDEVTTEELPSLWNDKMEELLGIRPSTDAEGILQDTHWSDGSFGYFPSYLLGSVYDGMFLEQIEKELGSIDELLAQGKIMEITKWLNKNIHQNGSLYTSAEVIRRLCQKEISAKPLLNYFNRKYSEIYSL
ncbi:MAG: carboxypeptidase M32 [Blautia sp.]|nr:carboxypeptidase M32 [Eubacteriales bacterium]MED9965283.1 carboxypeptidase M32 [Blautia sp.]